MNLCAHNLYQTYRKFLNIVMEPRKLNVNRTRVSSSLLRVQLFPQTCKGLNDLLDFPATPSPAPPLTPGVPGTLPGV